MSGASVEPRQRPTGTPQDRVSLSAVRAGHECADRSGRV